MFVVYGLGPYIEISVRIKIRGRRGIMVGVLKRAKRAPSIVMAFSFNSMVRGYHI